MAAEGEGGSEQDDVSFLRTVSKAVPMCTIHGEPFKEYRFMPVYVNMYAQTYFNFFQTILNCHFGDIVLINATIKIRVVFNSGL